MLVIWLVFIFAVFSLSSPPNPTLYAKLNLASEDEALPFAEQNCKARNKAAKFIRMEILSRPSIASRSAVVDCV